ncbi:glycerate kinase [Paenibacillus sp. MWE-103]|uniref:Glycerate kinase n=1 Tax=Paenibacillus artemisiicola TaxID=1172618 RepID=A0ABS3W2X3_9BACL|nr:glycerate kinase [Paenibacillus artemisiicola]MBO7742647.1 glycerate kinase [Paenibacillus artemisiicola]
MKIVVAPDSFKESMTARGAAAVMRAAIEAAAKETGTEADVVELPIGDGGEGTLEVLTAAMAGRLVEIDATGPLGEPVKATYGLSGDGATAIVEMAQASGLQLVPPEARDPLTTTTYGTGELIRHALGHASVRRLIVTIGGSATNDCGAGMLQALGAAVLDEAGRPIGRGGGALAQAARVDLAGLDRRLREVSVSVACDVTNPLVGPRGASRVFGPQKGATPETADALDAALAHFADVLEAASGERLHDVPGAGAAGGIGAALLLCGGKLMPGIELALDAIGFDAALAGADYVFTGEGRIDGQTPDGKAIAGIARRARAAGVPVVAFAGSLQPGYEPLYGEGLLAAFGITPRPVALADALREGETNLYRAVTNAVRLLAGARRRE